MCDDSAVACVANVSTSCFRSTNAFCKMTILDWVIYYNVGRPHSALGCGLPEPMSDQVPPNDHRHRLPIGYRIAKRSMLGALHHEYGLVKEAT